MCLVFVCRYERGIHSQAVLRSSKIPPWDSSGQRLNVIYCLQRSSNYGSRTISSLLMAFVWPARYLFLFLFFLAPLPVLLKQQIQLIVARSAQVRSSSLSLDSSSQTRAEVLKLHYCL